MAMTLADACEKATELAHLTLEFAGGTGTLSELFRILGLDPEAGKETLENLALDKLVLGSLDSFVDQGMVVLPRLA